MEGASHGRPLCAASCASPLFSLLARVVETLLISLGAVARHLVQDALQAAHHARVHCIGVDAQIALNAVGSVL